MATTLLPRRSFKTVAWKNGGGITHEALRVPAEGPFAWRISLAEIDRPGPFSDFAGYQRYMTLVQGAGIRLSFADGRQLLLREIGQLIQFDGGLAAHCDLLSGRCMDLNLMAANELLVSAQVYTLNGSWRGTLSPAAWGVLMPLTGPLTLRVGDQTPARLAALDLALIEPSESLELALGGPHSGTPTPVFFATISHGC